MRVNRDSWNKAVELRGFFASEFLKYHGPTDAKAGNTLVKEATRLGYTERKRAIPGRTIRDWLVNGGVPQWAVKTMIRYILDKGFIPEEDEVLDSILAYVLIDVAENEFKALLHDSELSKIDSAAVASSLRRIWHAKFKTPPI